MFSLHSDIPMADTQNFIKERFNYHKTSKILLPFPLYVGSGMYHKLYESAVEIANLATPRIWNTCTLPLPKETTPDFMTVDYAVDENGDLNVIELQAFPSVNFAMWELSDWFTQSKCSQEKRTVMHNAIAAKKAKAPVIVDNQLHSSATRFDFISAAMHFDVAHPEMLYCQNDKVQLLQHPKAKPVTSIFNRIIMDACSENERQCMLTLMASPDITWFNHPSWFYLINKGTMRHISHRDIPETIDANANLPKNLANWVLKRNDGFSSNSVIISPSKNDVVASRGFPSILQRKVSYTPCIRSSLSANPLCAEIRVMLIHNAATSKWGLLSMMGRITKNGDTSRATSGRGDPGEGVAVVLP